jgi:hypothetical protein
MLRGAREEGATCTSKGAECDRCCEEDMAGTAAAEAGFREGYKRSDMSRFVYSNDRGLGFKS